MQREFSKQELQTFFDSQLETLVGKGYATFADMSEDAFRKLFTSLRDKLRDIRLDRVGNIPLALVVRGTLVSAEDAMSQVVVNELVGEVRMTPKEPLDFKDLDSLNIPEGDVYVLLDIDTGQDFLNISPEVCAQEILSRNRTPLTQDEGVSLVMQVPQILTDKKRYNCIQMSGSRIEDDQRIPSIWLSYRKPRLGWCWNRNIHTWLGSASAKTRIGF
jgi:hypothetical protein